MTYLPSALAVLVAYLVGSLSLAVIVSRVMGLSDPRSYGSKNPGATNVLRSGNKAAAVLTLALDALKGYVPVLVALLLAPRFGWGETTVAWVGLAAFVGHLWPVFFNFKGGKGVATTAGGAIVRQQLLAAVLASLWYITLRFSKKASLASLVLMVGLPVGVAIKGSPGWEVGATAAINAVVFVRHLGNFKRLLTGKELSSQRQR